MQERYIITINLSSVEQTGVLQISLYRSNHYNKLQKKIFFFQPVVASAIDNPRLLLHTVLKSYSVANLGHFTFSCQGLANFCNDNISVLHIFQAKITFVLHPTLTFLFQQHCLIFLWIWNCSYIHPYLDSKIARMNLCMPLLAWLQN